MGGAAGAAFVSATGPVATNFALFAQVYTALFAPFQGAVHGVASSLAGQMGSLISILVLVVGGIFLAATALRVEETPVLSRLITHVLAPAAVVKVVLGAYDQYVIQPASTMAASLGTTIVSGIGGTSITGGGPFDTIWNHAYAAGVMVINAVPGGGMFPSKNEILADLAVGLYWLASAGAIGLSFILYLISQIGLYLLLAIGPIFLLFGAAQVTRFLLKGYVSALASVICTQVIVLALLAIATQVETTIISPLMTTAPNSNIWGMLQSLLIVGILLGACTVLAFKSSAYAVGICGGIFDGIAPWIAAGALAMRGTVATATAAAGSIGLVSRPVLVAARAMGRP